MDRNIFRLYTSGEEAVALRKECVDRNIEKLTEKDNFYTSLSARRAWIEICCWISAPFPSRVALRKESVDRNLSSKACCAAESVALRKESVDRNWIEDGKE